jgi:predicted ATP-grasp superfamily ATP-dependent carboligase
VTDTSTPVVVLKLFHQCGLGVARSLGRLGTAVYGVHESRRAPAATSRYLRETVEWNVDDAPAEASIALLHELADRIGDRAILIPTDDVAALFVSDNAAALAERFLFPAQDAKLVHDLYSKKEMEALARRYEVPIAETFFPESREEAAAFAEEAVYPVVLKAIETRLLEAEGHAIVHSAGELLAAFDRMQNTGPPNVALQNFIPGGPETVWMFNGYFDADSRCLVSFTGRKLRQHPAYTGMTSLGVVVRNDEVDSMTRRFLSALGYRGIVDLGYRYDERDGRYKLLDVNPRIGATFRLFVDRNGLDVARALYLDLTGQPVEPVEPVEGRKWLVENYDVASSVRYALDRRLSPRRWATSFRGVEEAAWFARDDFAPFARMLGKSAAVAGRKLARRLVRAAR